MCRVSRESVQWLTTEVLPGNKESKEHGKTGPSLTLEVRGPVLVKELC